MWSRGFAAGLAVVWLAGCASTSQTSGSGEENGTLAGGPAEETVVVTTPLVDPAVQAVMDSGKVQGFC